MVRIPIWIQRVDQVYGRIYKPYDSIIFFSVIAEDGVVIRANWSDLVIGMGLIDVQSIDSDSALAIAERNGGSTFRDQFPACTIRAHLSGLYERDFSGSIWWIRYQDGTNVKNISVNALTSNLFYFTSVRENKNSKLPLNPKVYQNYPDPFNPSTTITFFLAKSSQTKITVYDLLGQPIETLIDDDRPPGNYQVQFNGTHYSAGVYFYRFQAETYSETKKLVLLK